MTLYKNDIEACILALKTGGIILYPTDTVWGIGCDATNALAVEKIYALKKRTLEKSMIILLARDKDILKYVTQPDLQVFDYIKGINKPTTVIYEGARGLARNTINSDGTVAIRIVSEPFCKQLIEQFAKPIVSTSANISGYPPPGIFNEIDNEVKNGVDYIVQHRQDDLNTSEPSAIVRWNRSGIPTIIRK